MNTESLVHLFHILIVGGLFLYVGTQRTDIPSALFPVLFWLGIIIIFYHIFKVYKKNNTRKRVLGQPNSYSFSRTIINIHRL